MKPTKTETIMNLQAEVEELRANLSQVRYVTSELHNYLLSDKFHMDTTVQVNDVMRRTEEIFTLTVGN